MTSVSRSIGHTLFSLVVLQEGLARTRASVRYLKERTTFVVVVLVEPIISYMCSTQSLARMKCLVEN